MASVVCNIYVWLQPTGTPNVVLVQQDGALKKLLIPLNCAPSQVGQSAPSPSNCAPLQVGQTAPSPPNKWDT